MGIAGASKCSLLPSHSAWVSRPAIVSAVSLAAPGGCDGGTDDRAVPRIETVVAGPGPVGADVLVKEDRLSEADEGSSPNSRAASAVLRSVSLEEGLERWLTGETGLADCLRLLDEEEGERERCLAVTELSPS